MTLFLDWYNIIHVRHAYRTFAALAQLVEHVICNLGVVGPNPTGSFFGEFPEWSKGTDCKSAGLAFVGSNPSLPT